VKLFQKFVYQKIFKVMFFKEEFLENILQNLF